MVVWEALKVLQCFLFQGVCCEDANTCCPFGFTCSSEGKSCVSTFGHMSAKATRSIDARTPEMHLDHVVKPENSTCSTKKVIVYIYYFYYCKRGNYNNILFIVFITSCSVTLSKHSVLVIWSLVSLYVSHPSPLQPVSFPPPHPYTLGRNQYCVYTLVWQR